MWGEFFFFQSLLNVHGTRNASDDMEKKPTTATQ